MAESKPWAPGGQLEDGMKKGGAPPKKGSMGPPPQDDGKTMQDLPTFEGYGSGGVDQMSFAAPPPPVAPEGNAPPMEFTDIAKLDEEDCRNAMNQFVSENFCYGSKPAKEMKISDIKGVTALHFSLETFTESRKTGHKTKPYKGGPVDGPENGPPPLPWNIHCVPKQMFHEQTDKIEVPHTATVKPCHKCDARGYFVCWECGGWGRTLCDNCNASGQVEDRDVEGNPYMRTCHDCFGTGFERCDKCGGDGRITCKKCDGYRNLKAFIQLKVKFRNNLLEYIHETTDMPDELVKTVSGDLIFEQILPQVWPLTSYPVKAINDNSIRIVNQHKTAFPKFRQLQQRERLRAIPVTEANYEFEETKSRFWVYGLERKVHCPDYPQQCCWGCNVL